MRCGNATSCRSLLRLAARVLAAAAARGRPACARAATRLPAACGADVLLGQRASAAACGGGGRLKALGQSHGCTLFQLMLARVGAAAVPSRGAGGGGDRAPYHGRDAAGTEGLIGYFVNMLALRVEVPRGRCVCAAAAALEAAVGAMRHAARAVADGGARAATAAGARRVSQRSVPGDCWRGSESLLMVWRALRLVWHALVSEPWEQG